MKFFAFASVALAAVANVVAAIDSATVVMNIKDLTDLSSQTNQMVAGINLVNFAAKAPQVAQSIQKIVTVISTDVQVMLAGPSTAFTKDASTEVVVVLTDFVKVHQALLNTIIGKHGIITLVPFFGPPIAAALVALEKVVDSLAFSLIALIPSKKNEANEQFASLTVTLKSCQATYNPANSIINV